MDKSYFLLVEKQTYILLKITKLNTPLLSFKLLPKVTNLQL